MRLRELVLSRFKLKMSSIEKECVKMNVIEKLLSVTEQLMARSNIINNLADKALKPFILEETGLAGYCWCDACDAFCCERLGCQPCFTC